MTEKSDIKRLHRQTQPEPSGDALPFVSPHGLRSNLVRLALPKREDALAAYLLYLPPPTTSLH